MDDFFSDDNNEVTSVLAAKLSARARTEGKKEKDDYDGQLTVDVYQTESDIVVQSTIAGVDQNDIDIAVSKDMVTIKGRRANSEKTKTSDYYYQELFWGPFSRSIILPEDIDSDNAKASMKNGLLTIRLPKLSKSRIKKVMISG
ncbi:MAG: Hsp20/alpha crystallin family protein [Candidatus Colwellbacteria bacterium]|nr:Hsp20/alpha crystallin family protein [Candidatus Colwellbacteria bacterium]